jgi:hypothetical protein
MSETDQEISCNSPTNKLDTLNGLRIKSLQQSPTYHPGLSRNDDPSRGEVLNVLFDLWLVEKMKVVGQQDRSVGTRNPAGKTALCPAMSVAPTVVPQLSFHLSS